MAVELFQKCHTVLPASGVCFNSVGAGVAVTAAFSVGATAALLYLLRKGVWVGWWQVPQLQEGGALHSLKSRLTAASLGPGS